MLVLQGDSRIGLYAWEVLRTRLRTGARAGRWKRAELSTPRVNPGKTHVLLELTLAALGLPGLGGETEERPETPRTRGRDLGQTPGGLHPLLRACKGRARRGGARRVRPGAQGAPRWSGTRTTMLRAGWQRVSKRVQCVRRLQPRRGRLDRTAHRAHRTHNVHTLPREQYAILVARGRGPMIARSILSICAQQI